MRRLRQFVELYFQIVEALHFGVSGPLQQQRPPGYADILQAADLRLRIHCEVSKTVQCRNKLRHMACAGRLCRSALHRRVCRLCGHCRLPQLQGSGAGGERQIAFSRLIEIQDNIEQFEPRRFHFTAKERKRRNRNRRFGRGQYRTPILVAHLKARDTKRWAFLAQFNRSIAKIKRVDFTKLFIEGVRDARRQPADGNGSAREAPKNPAADDQKCR